MFTREELEVAYECALNYPTGWGDSFFYDTKHCFIPDTIKRIKDNPDCVRFG